MTQGGTGTDSRREVDALLATVSRRTGLVFPAERRGHAADVVLRLMRGRGLDDVAAYGRLLVRNVEAFDELVAELTIGETFFFRDPSQFAAIRDHFPDELARRRPADHEIRVWSAGCATGEEAWSLAILFEELGLGGRTRVLGSDLSRAALERARAGVYRPWSLRGESASRAGAWVQPHGDRFVVSPRLRTRVTFAPLNLADEVYPEPFTNFDLVLCRNVLIYFDEATIRGVARRLYESLAPGGWLIVGASDPPIGAFAPFERLETPRGIVHVRPSEASDGPRSTRRPTDGTATETPSARRVAGDAELSSNRTSRETSVDLRDGTSPLDTGRAAEPFDVPPPPVETVAGEVTVEASTDARENSESESETRARLAERIRSLANDDVEAAIGLAGEATRAHDLDVELHYLHAVLLADDDRLDEAAAAARRALFLDRTLVVGHVVLGTIRRRQGDGVAARRAFVNARRHCRELAGDALVPFAEGACAEVVQASVERFLGLLDSTANGTGEAR